MVIGGRKVSVQLPREMLLKMTLLTTTTTTTTIQRKLRQRGVHWYMKPADHLPHLPLPSARNVQISSWATHIHPPTILCRGDVDHWWIKPPKCRSVQIPPPICKQYLPNVQIQWPICTTDLHDATCPPLARSPADHPPYLPVYTSLPLAPTCHTWILRPTLIGGIHVMVPSPDHF